MKRSISISENQLNFLDVDSGKTKKKIREDLAPEPEPEPAVLLDENLLYEVLKHVDARTLGAAGCVNKQWHRTAQDERLWELICTRHWANIGCGNNQLRSVVLALGGFRRLHSHYLWPLSKPSTSTAASSSSSTVATAGSSSSWPCLPPPRTITPAKPTAKTRWGKDETDRRGRVYSCEDGEHCETLKSPTVSNWMRHGEQKYKRTERMVECGG